MSVCSTVNRWAPPVGWVLLAAGMVPVTIVFHAFRVVEPAQLFNQTNQFLKNRAISGALLVIAGMGPGRVSLDARREAGRAAC